MTLAAPAAQGSATGVPGPRVALVTGAAGGQGRAFVERLLQDGFAVVATDLVAEVTCPRGEDTAYWLGLQHDVSVPGDWHAVVEAALDRFGRIDVLVNNAGYLRAASLAETDVETFERHVRVNQFGVYLGMSAVLPHMRASGSGSIINIASVGGLKGFAGEFAYCTAKWAVRGMTRCAAIELAPMGIRVNAICPGPIDTPMLGTGEAVRWADFVPLGRLGRPGEVAGLVAFLASESSSYITGAEIPVDGGMIA